MKIDIIRNPNFFKMIYKKLKRIEIDTLKRDFKMMHIIHNSIKNIILTFVQNEYI